MRILERITDKIMGEKEEERPTRGRKARKKGNEILTSKEKAKAEKEAEKREKTPEEIIKEKERNKIEALRSNLEERKFDRDDIEEFIFVITDGEYGKVKQRIDMSGGTKIPILNMKIPNMGELKEPICMLMRHGGDVEIIDGATSGIMTVTGSDEVEKSIYLDPVKLRRIPCADGDIMGWIADEDSATCFPQEPIYDSEQMNKLFSKLLTNFKQFDSDMGKGGDTNIFKYVMALIILIAALLGLWPQIKGVLGI